MRAYDFIAESKQVEYHGVHLDVSIDGASVDVRALTNDGIQMAYVVFDRDGKTLVADDLAVEERFRGQGIAAVMYDYVKSLGFKIERSYDQTEMGKAFWDKNKGEERIWEARKHAELNPKVSINQQIFNAMKRHKETFKANNLEIPNVFVSFTKLPKLGINPQSRYRTPIGIYAYPASYVISELGNTLNPAESLPFAGDQPYANIFSLKSGAGVLVVSNDETAQYQPYYDKLSSMFSKDEVDRLKLLGQHGEPGYRARVPNHTGGVFWFVTMKLADKLMRQRNMESMSLAWNVLFRQIGIQAVIDYGDGIIHENEPTQMTVYDPSIITDVTLADNKYSKAKIDRSVAHGKENINQKKQAMEFVKNNSNDSAAIASYLYYTARGLRSYVIPRLSPKVRLELIEMEPDTIKFIKNPSKEEISLALRTDLVGTLHNAGKFVSTDQLVNAINNLYTGGAGRSILKYNRELPVLLALVKKDPHIIQDIYNELTLMDVPTVVWKTAYLTAKQNPAKYAKTIEFIEGMNELGNFF